MRENIKYQVLSHNGGKKIVQHHPLIMPPDHSLNFLEGSMRMLFEQQVGHQVMKAQECRLQLRYDHILIIPRVGYNSSFRIAVISWQTRGCRVFWVTR